MPRMNLQKPVALLLVILFVVSGLAALPTGSAGDTDETAPPADDRLEADRFEDLDGLPDDVGDLLPALPGDPRDDTVAFLVGTHGQTPERLTRITEALGGQIVREDAHLDFTLVRVPIDQAEPFQDEARHTPGVTYVKEDHALELHFVPDDPRYTEQWGPAAIGMETAWDTTRGDHNTTVAVIDTGVAYDHPDLADNVCTLGPDFGQDDADPDDTYGHGTHVAGTVAAAIDNGIGVAGMADACIMPVKVEAYGGLTISGASSAIRWAADNGADIIQMSWGAYFDVGAPLDSAIRYASDAGVLPIASAGNAYCGTVGFPAAYPEVVAVASLDDPGDTRSSFSSCGPAVEVSAPGRDILSTVPDSVSPDGYSHASGTSMASPHVSGAAAALWSAHPDLSRDEVRCLLAQKAVDLGTAGRDEGTGFGRIDVPAMIADPVCVATVPEVPPIRGMSGNGTAHIGWDTPFHFGDITGYTLHRGATADDLSVYATVGDVHAYEDTAVATGETWYYAVQASTSAGTGPLSEPFAITVADAVTPDHVTDFESGLGDWDATGLWHLTPDRTASGASAYFGQENGAGLEDNDYDTGSPETGSLVSPPVDLTDATTASLSFWTFHELEGWPYEHAAIQVSSPDEPGLWQTVWSMRGLPYEGPAAADLTDFVGSVVQVRLHVDADAYDNGFEGWYVDDLVLAATAPADLDPFVGFLAPDQDDLVGTETVMGGQYSDPNGDADVDTVTLSVDGNTTDATFFDTYWIAEVSGLTSGEHTATATATDGAGSTGVAEVTFLVDAEPPEVTIENPSAGTVADCSLTVSGHASDTGGAGLYYLVLRADDHYAGAFYLGGGDPSAQDWMFEIDLAQVEAGARTLTATVYDRAFNSGTTNVSIERSDFDCRPDVTIDAPDEGTHATCTVTIRGTARAADTGVPLSHVYVLVAGHYVDGIGLGGGQEESWETTAALGSFPAGNLSVVAHVYDEEHRSNKSAPLTIVRDASSCLPETTIDSPSDGASVDCGQSVTGTVSSPYGARIETIYLYAGTSWLGGIHAGHEGDLAGSWSIDASMGRLEPGSYSLTAYAHDADGNANMSVAQDFVLEVDCRPTVTIDSPADGSEVGCSAVFTGTATAGPDAELRYVDLFTDHSWLGYAYFDDGATTADWSIDARLGRLDPGTHAVYAYVRDTHGVNQSEPIDIVQTVDCAPTVTIDAPADGSAVDCVTTFSGHAIAGPDAELYYVELRLDGYGWNSLGWVDFDPDTDESDWSLDAKLGHLQPGTYSVVAIVHDSATWNVSAPVEVDLDMDCAPQLTITSPADLSTVFGVVDVTGTITLPNNTTSADLTVYAGQNVIGHTETTDGTWSFDWNTYTLDNGTYTVSAEAHIPENGAQASTHVEVTVENDRFPYTTSERQEGRIGCSIGLLGLRSDDTCGEASDLGFEVQPGLTGGRLVLTWDADAVAGLDALSVTATHGVHSWTATSAPGDDRIELVLSNEDDQILADAPGTLSVKVRAAHGGGPTVAYDESFDVDVVTGYWGAEV